MKKGQIITAEVIGLHFPNRGICKVVETPDSNHEDEPKTIRVKNVLPGQKIAVRVAKMRHGNPEGALQEVLEQGEHEYAFTDAEHVCPRYPACGGCMYQTLPYEEQIQVKKDMMAELFVPVLGQESYENLFQGIVYSPDTTEYRNKMEFSFGNSEKDGPLELGMHKRGSFYDIEDASCCRIVDEDFRQAVELTRSFFRKEGVTFFHKNTHEGFLRHLLVRKARKTGQILIDLVTSSQEPWMESKGKTADDLLQAWSTLLQEATWKGQLTGILHTKNDRISDVVCDEGTDVLYGQGYFEEKLLGLTFQVTPFSFFQTNSLGAEKLYGLARDFILHGDSRQIEANEVVKQIGGENAVNGEPLGALDSDVSGPNEADNILAGKTVFDLYSGTGTIAQILSPSAEKLVGVEIVEEAVEAARENAKKNGITNCEFLCGDVLKVIDSITDKPDMIVLDPPRDGVNPKALAKILDYGVHEILYISCKPTSLARDIPAMREAGYEPIRMAGVDMFPSTPQCEMMCLLRRREEYAGK